MELHPLLAKIVEATTPERRMTLADIDEARARGFAARLGGRALAVAEIAPAVGEIAALAAQAGPPVKEVALIFDYQSDWVTDIQPQGQGFSGQSGNRGK